VTFWTGNHPLAIGEGDLAANPPIKEAELAFRRAHPGLTPEQMEPLYYRDAFAHIRADPGWWLSLLARKAVYTVVPIGRRMRYTQPNIASLRSFLTFSCCPLRRRVHDSCGGDRSRPRQPACWLDQRCSFP
jgi:hypothetical protein